MEDFFIADEMLVRDEKLTSCAKLSFSACSIFLIITGQNFQIETSHIQALFLWLSMNWPNSSTLSKIIFLDWGLGKAIHFVHQTLCSPCASSSLSCDLQVHISGGFWQRLWCETGWWQLEWNHWHGCCKGKARKNNTPDQFGHPTHLFVSTLGWRMWRILQVCHWRKTLTKCLFQEADIGMSWLDITEYRSEVVDFFTPLSVGSSSFLIKYPEENQLLYYSNLFQVVTPLKHHSEFVRNNLYLFLFPYMSFSVSVWNLVLHWTHNFAGISSDDIHSQCTLLFTKSMDKRVCIWFSTSSCLWVDGESR